MIAGTIACSFLYGCDPDDVPRFSPDGKAVAVILPPEKDKKGGVLPVRLLDLEKKEWRHIELPERWSAGAQASPGRGYGGSLTCRLVF